jgi:hypothetical protein
MSDQLKDLAKKESYTPKPVTYNTNLEKLLKENSEECESLSILHRMSYEKYNTRSNYINIPVIILSSAIGFITGIDLQYAQMNIILGVGSVFVGIIKSVDTYFQLAKRAESHRICSLQFSQISKKMQVELTLHRNQRMTAENMMNIIKTDIKNMQDIAPLIDDDIISIYNAKYRKYKRVKKPNFVNGLTDVVVNSNNNEFEYEYSSRHGSREASPVNNQNEQRVPSHDPEYEQQLAQSQTQDVQSTQHINQGSISKMNNNNLWFNTQEHINDDNDSIDPIQPTIISTTSLNPGTTTTQLNRVSEIENQSIRKSPSISNTVLAPVQPSASVSQSDLLRVLTQLQQQGIGTGLAQLSGNIASLQQVSPYPDLVAPNLSPQQSVAANPLSVPTSNVNVPNDVGVPNANPSVSPTGSIRSNSSIPLGVIQTDNSGNQVVNT